MIMHACATILLTAALAFCGPIDNLRAGEWYEVPNSHLRSVAPVGWGANVIAPWCGGAFDTKRSQLLVWGGGHGDYAGNELYAFSLDSLKWFRLTDPSSITGVTGCPLIMPDSQPVSRHTYAGLVYSDTLDRLVAAGGFSWPCAYGDPWVWMFDYDQNKWVKNANLGFGSRAMLAYDPSTGHLWCRGGGGTGLWESDVSGNWSQRNVNNFGSIYDVDPVNHWLVGLNRGSVAYHPVAGNPGPAATYNTSGDTAAINAAMPAGDYCTPGFVWDPIIEKFVAWSGGADVYILDGTTHAFTRVAPAATNTVTPTAAAAQGTYGRWRYSPKYNAYVVVNSVDQNVFIYRLTDSAGTKNEAGPESGKSDFTISPNPLRAGSSMSISRPGLFTVLDVCGKIIFRSQERSWKTPATLCPGLYLVQWTGKDGRPLCKPVMVIN